jgi:hypothetical protein
MTKNEQVTRTFHIPREIAERDYPNAQHHYSVWDLEFTSASGVELWVPEQGKEKECQDGK